MANWSGHECMRADGTYSPDEGKQWEGSATVAKYKCEHDDACQGIVHTDPTRPISWRVCKTLNYDPAGEAETLVVNLQGNPDADGICRDRAGYLLCQTVSHKQLLIEACRRKDQNDQCMDNGRCIAPVPGSFCYSSSLEMAEILDCGAKSHDDECEIKGPRNMVDAKGHCTLTPTGTKLCESKRRHRVLVASCDGLVPGEACSVFDGMFQGNCFKMPSYCMVIEDEGNSTNATGMDAADQSSGGNVLR